jgi:hypothetical protein
VGQTKDEENQKSHSKTMQNHETHIVIVSFFPELVIVGK